MDRVVFVWRRFVGADASNRVQQKTTLSIGLHGSFFVIVAAKEDILPVPTLTLPDTIYGTLSMFAASTSTAAERAIRSRDNTTRSVFFQRTRTPPSSAKGPYLILTRRPTVK